MKAAAEVFILVDPVQDYEETLSIIGVYGSLAAAKAALPRHRRRPYVDGGLYEFSPYRSSEVQRWRGDQCLQTWTFSPRSGWSRPDREVGDR